MSVFTEENMESWQLDWTCKGRSSVYWSCNILCTDPPSYQWMQTVNISHIKCNKHARLAVKQVPIEVQKHLELQKNKSRTSIRETGWQQKVMTRYGHPFRKTSGDLTGSMQPSHQFTQSNPFFAQPERIRVVDWLMTGQATWNDTWPVDLVTKCVLASWFGDTMNSASVVHWLPIQLPWRCFSRPLTKKTHAAPQYATQMELWYKYIAI